MLKNTQIKNSEKYCKILKYILKVLENTENIEYNWPILKKLSFQLLLNIMLIVSFQSSLFTL